MNSPLVVLVVGVPLWYLLDYFGVRVLHEPKRSLTEAEYLDWHKGSTFACRLRQIARKPMRQIIRKVPGRILGWHP